MVTYSIAKQIIDENLKTIIPDFKMAFQELENNHAVVIKASDKIVFFTKENNKLFLVMLSDATERNVKIETGYHQLKSFFDNAPQTGSVAQIIEEFSKYVSNVVYEDEIFPILMRELSNEPIMEEAVERISVNVKLQLKENDIDVQWVRHIKIFYDTSTQRVQITLGPKELEYDLDGNIVSSNTWNGNFIEPWEKTT